MYNSDFLRLSILREDSFNQTTIMSIIVGAAKPSTKPQMETMPHTPQFVATICLIIVCKIAIFIFIARIFKLSRNGKLTINRLKQLPCRNCRYFKESHYLNCAVHPSIVLTKEAINCSDYWSKSSMTSPESTDDRLR